MAKTKREIKESLNLVDIVYEVIDARMPDVYKRQAEDVFMKDIMKGDIIGYDLVSKYLISDFMTCLLYTSRCV